MAVACLRNPVGHRVFVFCIVQDQEPLRPPCTLAEIPSYPRCLVRGGERGKLRLRPKDVVDCDEFALHPPSAIPPEHLPITTPKLLRIVTDKRRLANSAHLSNCLHTALRQRGSGLLEEHLVNSSEIPLTPNEELCAPIWHV